MKNNHIKFLASFMIALMLTLPIYSASVLGQFDDFSTLPDPVQSCIDKNEKTNALVDLMDNEIISTIEKILRAYRTLSSVWENAKGLYNTVILVLYQTKFIEAEAAERELARIEGDILSGAHAIIRYALTCELPDNIPSACDIPIHGIGKLDPYSNVYTAIGCLCLPAILFNMRTLQRIYVEHNCCVEQACNAGVSTESCEITLNEKTCKFFGKGALFQGLVGLVVQAASSFISKQLFDKWFQENPKFWGTITSLARAPFMIKSLITSFQSLQNTFSDPTCENLGFKDVKDDILDQQRNLFRQQNCRFEPIDFSQPPDGIFDDLIYVCED